MDPPHGSQSNVLGMLRWLLIIPIIQVFVLTVGLTGAEHPNSSSRPHHPAKPQETSMTPNRLITEKSPYLLQHAYNPVKWYPWSEEAFETARREDKPIFLSVGYATCHWCHVMERESFEDPEAARQLNDTFISIKVDREERPDVDAVYMAVCQMMTGSGGWPLTIIMTPDKQPFFAATYLPKETRFGRMGLVDLSQRIRHLWQTDRQKILESAGVITGHLGNAFSYSSAKNLQTEILEKGFRQIKSEFDPKDGGFGTVPKFPTPHRLSFLLRYNTHHDNPSALTMVEQTLQAMRRGGIWDHVGYGFHRYSTDGQWLLPHFEKMLYDQALLAMAYLEAYQITQDPQYVETAELIFEYVLRDMTSQEGAFFTAEDADSEGEEGKFYVWTRAEFEEVFGNDTARKWADALRVIPEGNFLDEATHQKTGANIIYWPAQPTAIAAQLGLSDAEFSKQWHRLRQKLYTHRQKRVRPLRDDKILTDWNGLMIAALAYGARVTGNPRYGDAADRAARFFLTRMRHANGRLWHRYRDGEAGVPALADDYAFFITGLLQLYLTRFEVSTLTAALELQDLMNKDFWDTDQGGFFMTDAGRKDLPVRPKELYDGALPSANSASLGNLVFLSRLTGDPRWETRAASLANAFGGSIQRHPSAFTQFLSGLTLQLGVGTEVVVVGEKTDVETRDMLRIVHSRFAPNLAILLKTPRNEKQLQRLAPFTEALSRIDGAVTAYVCTNFSCDRPITSPEKLEQRLSTPSMDSHG